MKDIDNSEKRNGLSDAGVSARKEAGLVNKAITSPSKTIGEIIASNIFTYFNFVFLFLAILLLAVRSFRDLSFLPLIIINSLIGILQELRAKQILDKLTVLHSPDVLVIRNGKEQKIKVYELVMDDVMVLAAGDQIPADAILLDGEMAVNESLLTGEADEITKHSQDELL